VPSFLVLTEKRFNGWVLRLPVHRKQITPTLGTILIPYAHEME